jgi:catechol 2,3-dioxygenase-like lactoylglutathione lyase family enzyme
VITRFDHFVIGVRDLDAAVRHYQKLGFDVRPGGKHVGLGTHNAIIRFGLDYIELISVYDDAEATSGRLAGQELVNFLHAREGGLLGYALASSNLEDEARLFDSGDLVTKPFAMQRKRPDGNVLAWRLLVPGNVSWRRPWPFFIQWDTPDEQRLSWEGPGSHANGARSWSSIAVVVRDLDRMSHLYRQFGLEEEGYKEEIPHLGAVRSSFAVPGSSRVDLLMPVDNGPIQKMLDEIGEGPYEATLAVNDLDQTISYLKQQGVNVEQYASGSVLLLPEQTLGARIVLSGPSSEVRTFLFQSS